MRILLNLLPQEKQQSLSRRFYSHFFLWQSCLVLFLIVFYIIVLGGIYGLLGYQIKGAQTALASSNQYNQEAQRLTQYQDVFKRANLLSSEVGRYLDRHHTWGLLLQLLERLTPAGVALTELSTKGYTVSIIGRAETREAFLDFEAALKGSDCTSDVKVPLSNLFTQTELDFQLDVNVRSACLRDEP